MSDTSRLLAENFNYIVFYICYERDLALKMKITKELKQELISELKFIFPNQKLNHLDNFQKLL